MRTFIAVELNEAARQTVVNFQLRLKHRVENLKWTRAEQLHLTLVFLDHIADSQALEISSAIEEAAREQSPFDLRFDRLGVFPTRGSVSVLWLGVGNGASDLIALQDQITQRLARRGFPREERPFIPHLTLARNRDPFAGRRVRAMLDEKLMVPLPDFPVTRLTYFRSILEPPLARHEVISRHELTRRCEAHNP